MTSRPLTKADPSRSHDPYFVPPLPEGSPHTLPLDQDAAHFLISQVHAHPHQVTICALGPLTNIALAISIDPHFAELTQGIYLMGGSLDPQTDDPEFSTSPRHEFNFWFDPEAAHIVLRAHWPRIDVTTVDVSIKGKFTQKMVDEIAQSPNPAAQYIVRFSKDRYYLWDELAASTLLDPSIITAERLLYMDVDLSHGPSYGNTLTWTAPLKPETDVQLVHAQMDLDLPKFTTHVRRPDESATPPKVKEPCQRSRDHAEQICSATSHPHVGFQRALVNLTPFDPSR